MALNREIERPNMGELVDQTTCFDKIRQGDAWEFVEKDSSKPNLLPIPLL